jgi:glutathione S-transferase
MAANKAVRVYGWAVSPYVARPLLALEEAGVEYELVPMSRDAGDHRRPDHLARNVRGPLQRLPPSTINYFFHSSIAELTNS